ncbi:MAG: RNA polymerase sporulation sigma factor SigH [Lachnospiraceae bacterium]|nr:RNA polymerase sporulation sigma factor SigH [Lachnospiraceae bacterium]
MSVFESYHDYTDEELLSRLRDGETAITDYLMEKYKNLVRSKAKTMFILGADNDDLIQEGMIGLFKAVRDYDSGRDASFYTFAELCIARQMYTAIQASGRKKHMPLNSYISLYSNMAQDDSREEGAEAILVNALAAEGETNPEELFIDKENAEQLEHKLHKELSPFERQVLDLYMTGMGYIQIARVLGRDEKSADNALQRVKAKLRKVLA